MKLLRGKQYAQDILDELANRIATEKLRPGLGIIFVGNDPASELYIRLKEEAARKLGVMVEKMCYPAGTREKDIQKKIETWNKDKRIHGILVQLPLPQTLNPDKIIRTIDPSKDVDGFHPKNMKRVKAGKRALRSPLILTIDRLLRETGEDYAGGRAVVVGKSQVFMTNVERVLEQNGLDVKVLSSVKSRILRDADVVVTALGKPHILRAEHIKNGATIIDIGINKRNGKIVGDVHPQGLESYNGYRTPVPGGVGPMVVAMLLSNVVEVASVNA